MNAPVAGKFRDPSLVDFGADAGGMGRRLELLGTVLVDRPLLQPDLPRRRSPHWTDAAAISNPDTSLAPIALAVLTSASAASNIFKLF